MSNNSFINKTRDSWIVDDFRVDLMVHHINGGDLLFLFLLLFALLLYLIKLFNLSFQNQFVNFILPSQIIHLMFHLFKLLKHWWLILPQLLKLAWFWLNLFLESLNWWSQSPLFDWKNCISFFIILYLLNQFISFFLDFIHINFLLRKLLWIWAEGLLSAVFRYNIFLKRTRQLFFSLLPMNLRWTYLFF